MTARGELLPEEREHAADVVSRYLLLRGEPKMHAQPLMAEDFATLQYVREIGDRDGGIYDDVLDEDWIIGRMATCIVLAEASEAWRREIFDLVQLRIGSIALELDRRISDEVWLAAIDAPTPGTTETPHHSAA